MARVKITKQSVIAILLGTAALAASCTNQRLEPPNAEELDLLVPDGAASPYRISNVTIAAQSSNTDSSTVSVFFDSSSIPAPLTESCTRKSNNNVSDKPCLCQFTWKQVNPFSTTSSPIPRLIFTNVTDVQSYKVDCVAPEIYNQDDEIPVGTVLNISVVSAPSSPISLVTSQYKHTKTLGSTTGGSFQDAQGRHFDDILRYTCYEQFQRGMTITSKKAMVNRNGEEVMTPLASQFCIAKAGDAAGGVEGCQNLPPQENSAQAYYYNLYTRESEIGGINYANKRYVCPKVKEPLIPGMGSGHHWPLDASFALSLGPTSDFPVGVEAFTKIANGPGDIPSQGSVCYPPKGSTDDDSGDVEVGGNDTLVQSCLGFAAKPNPDGTCPYFKDSTGKIRHTFRLRRFVALYPPVFDTNGDPVNQAQAVDTIYVLDRPVFFSGTDENKPYTMRGPKPCPFAYFDHKAVLGTPDGLYPGGVRPTYAATNHSAWKGKNVDGIQLPNTDSVNSCAAVLPVFNDDMTVLSMATVHASNPEEDFKRRYIRPVRPWAPHYVEDTDFLACAPQANVLRDPPLHFAKDTTTGNVSWCAEAYPTQNDNVAALDKRPNQSSPYYGKVAPFTSHVVKNSTSLECSARTPSIPANYPAETGNSCPLYPASGNPVAFARHPSDLVIDQRTTSTGVENVCSNKTCDRTVAAGTITWAKFPLLAPPAEVEKALISDTTYGCVMTYDDGGGKTGTKSPTEGCCGLSVSVWTGVPADGETNPRLTNLSAHLEPDQRCLMPKY